MRLTAVRPGRGRGAAQAAAAPGGVAARDTFHAGRSSRVAGGVRCAGERADAEAAAAYTVAARCSELGPAEAAVAGRRGTRPDEGGASEAADQAPLLARRPPVEEPKAPEAGVLRGWRAGRVRRCARRGAAQATAARCARTRAPRIARQTHRGGKPPAPLVGVNGEPAVCAAGKRVRESASGGAFANEPLLRPRGGPAAGNHARGARSATQPCAGAAMPRRERPRRGAARRPKASRLAGSRAGAPCVPQVARPRPRRRCRAGPRGAAASRAVAWLRSPQAQAPPQGLPQVPPARRAAEPHRPAEPPPRARPTTS